MWQVRTQGSKRPEVAVVGLGLVGGSLARALTAAGYRVLGVDRESVRRAARAAGAVATTVGTVERAARADVVVLAAPPAANRRLLRRLARVARAGLVVTDVGSVKGPIVRDAEALGLRSFVGGHAMAGTERKGFGASSAGLFRGAAWWIVPAPDSRATRAVRSLVRSVGARPQDDRRRRARSGGGLPEPRTPGDGVGPPGSGPVRPRRSGGTSPARARGFGT